MSEGSDQKPGPGRDQRSFDSGAWDHLGRLIRERRAELGLTQREVHSFGGPSPATLYQLESGHPGSYRPHILRRLERALGWGPGSVRRALAGGQPLLDSEGEVTPPLQRERPSQPPQTARNSDVDGREWMAGFRRLPLDTHRKLLILSSLLQETIADLDAGAAGSWGPAGPSG